LRDYIFFPGPFPFTDFAYEPILNSCFGNICRVTEGECMGFKLRFAARDPAPVKSCFKCY